MSDSLDVIIVDDEPLSSSVVEDMLRTFYTWGEIHSFNDVDKAIAYCRKKEAGIAIFILDVYLGGETGFGFLDAIDEKFPMAYEDSIIMTGNASTDIVNMCVASNITYLIEKPIRSYTLQLAVRAIVSKYIRFAKKLLKDPTLVEKIAGF